MIYKVITDSIQIETLQKKLVDRLCQLLPQKLIHDVGFQGGNREENIQYSREIDLWFTSSDDVEGCERHWNAFGIQIPAKKSLDIAVEINIPFEHNPRVGGVFLCHVSGKVFLAHRGTISGGRKGIGKALFMEQFDQKKLVDADDNGKEIRVALISELDSPDLAKKIKWFAEEISRIKQIGVSRFSNKSEV